MATSIGMKTCCYLAMLLGLTLAAPPSIDSSTSLMVNGFALLLNPLLKRTNNSTYRRRG
jgi:hypothetical protein